MAKQLTRPANPVSAANLTWDQTAHIDADAHARLPLTIKDWDGVVWHRTRGTDVYFWHRNGVAVGMKRYIELAGKPGQGAYSAEADEAAVRKLHEKYWTMANQAPDWLVLPAVNHTLQTALRQSGGICFVVNQEGTSLQQEVSYQYPAARRVVDLVSSLAPWFAEFSSPSNDRSRIASEACVAISADREQLLAIVRVLDETAFYKFRMAADLLGPTSKNISNLLFCLADGVVHSAETLRRRITLYEEVKADLVGQGYKGDISLTCTPQVTKLVLPFKLGERVKASSIGRRAIARYEADSGQPVVLMWSGAVELADIEAMDVLNLGLNLEADLVKSVPNSSLKASARLRYDQVVLVSNKREKGRFKQVLHAEITCPPGTPPTLVRRVVQAHLHHDFEVLAKVTIGEETFPVVNNLTAKRRVMSI